MVGSEKVTVNKSPAPNTLSDAVEDASNDVMFMRDAPNAPVMYLVKDLEFRVLGLPKIREPSSNVRRGRDR